MAAPFCARSGGPQGTSGGLLKTGGNDLIYREKITLQKAGFGLLLRRGTAKKSKQIREGIPVG
jgi:hypothetical protein